MVLTQNRLQAQISGYVWYYPNNYGFVSSVANFL